MADSQESMSKNYFRFRDDTIQLKAVVNNCPRIPNSVKDYHRSAKKQHGNYAPIPGPDSLEAETDQLTQLQHKFVDLWVYRNKMTSSVMCIK